VQAERVIEELQARGILRERVIGISVVASSGPVVFDFIVTR
jgi:hypothetical protein